MFIYYYLTSKALPLQYVINVAIRYFQEFLLGFLTLENGTDRLSPNVGKVLALYAA